MGQIDVNIRLAKVLNVIQRLILLDIYLKIPFNMPLKLRV